MITILPRSHATKEDIELKDTGQDKTHTKRISQHCKCSRPNQKMHLEELIACWEALSKIVRQTVEWLLEEI